MAVLGDEKPLALCVDLHCSSGLQHSGWSGTTRATPDHLRESWNKLQRETAVQRRADGWDGSGSDAQRRPGCRQGADSNQDRPDRWTR